VLILLLVHLAAALAATVVALLVLQGPLRTFLASRAASGALDPGTRRLLFGALAAVGVTSGAFLGAAGGGAFGLLAGADAASAAAIEALRGAFGAWRGLAFAVLFLVGIGFLAPAAEGQRPLVRASTSGGMDRNDRGRAEPGRLPATGRGREGTSGAPRPLREPRGGDPRRSPVVGGGSGGSGGRGGGPGRERREGREGREREGREREGGRGGREGREWQGRDRERERDREAADRERPEHEGRTRGSLAQEGWEARDPRAPMRNGSLPVAARHRGSHGARPLPGDTERAPGRTAISAPEAVEKGDA
jgi:hypothetical protein